MFLIDRFRKQKSRKVIPSVEKLSLKFDIQKLRKHLKEKVLPLPATYNGKHYHGWSVLSSNGSHTDGWYHGSSCFKEVGKSSVFDKGQASRVGLRPEIEYNRPTEICTGYLAEVMEEIKANGLRPCRARIICLQPHKRTNWHRDHNDGHYWMRLHIPIVSNDRCAFLTLKDVTHMKDDGSAYLTDVAQMHMAVNEGEEARYHLVMQVWDTAGLSKNYQICEDDISLI